MIHMTLRLEPSKCCSNEDLASFPSKLFPKMNIIPFFYPRSALNKVEYFLMVSPDSYL